MPKQPWSAQNYVGIQLFSGAPNPRWPLDQVPKPLLDAVERLPERALPADYLVPNAWYGGVVIHKVDDRGTRRRIVINNQYVFDSMSNVVRFDEGRRLEADLFGTIPGELVKRIGRLIDGVPEVSFKSVTEIELNERYPIQGIAPSEGQEQPACRHAPEFELPPTDWDTLAGIANNNCYNYANDEFSEIDDAIPGQQPFAPMTIAEMHQRLLDDNLVPVAGDRQQLPQHCTVESGAHLIAVCMRIAVGTNASGETIYKDFHCFRLDDDGAGGCWSHKDGENPRTDQDNATQRLTSLKAGRFKLEQDLVGFYWSITGTRTISFPQGEG